MQATTDAIREIIARMQSGEQLSVRQAKIAAKAAGVLDDPDFRVQLTEVKAERSRVAWAERERKEKQRIARENMASRQVVAAVETLRKAGATIEHASGDLSGSVYLRLKDGRSVRVADHALPTTGQGYRGDRWDEELVFNGRGDEGAAVEMAKGLMI